VFQSQSNQEEDIGILQLEKENVRKEDKVKERGLITPKKKEAWMLNSACLEWLEAKLKRKLKYSEKYPRFRSII
jgi:hypothetical protein